MIEEIWKDIPNYEGVYQVSNLGNVKSLKSRWGNRKVFRLLKPSTDTSGYFQVVLSKNNNNTAFKVHKLVAMAFLGHIPDGTQKVVVDHINNIRNDNRLSNLQLTTQRHNTSKDKNGTSKYTGVCWDKQVNKWKSAIYINGKRKTLGVFKCELAASQAYQNALKTII
jgi:hypothetical protein